MKAVPISIDEWNYKKEDGSYLLDEHVFSCENFKEDFGIVQYYDYTYNFINSECKKLLKANVDQCTNFNKGFAEIVINYVLYYIDKECNFYYSIDKISFKTLYNKYPNMRSELIEIIDKYTYHNVEEYFNI